MIEFVDSIERLNKKRSTLLDSKYGIIIGINQCYDSLELVDMTKSWLVERVMMLVCSDKIIIYNKEYQSRAEEIANLLSIDKVVLDYMD